MFYRYYKFTPLKLRFDSAGSVQISELMITYNNIRVDYSTAVASNPKGLNPKVETPAKAIDSLINTKWLDFKKGSLVIDFNKQIIANGYTFATADDVTDRDPVSWTLSGSNDNYNWLIINTQTNYQTPLNRNSYLPNFILELTITNFSIPTKIYGNAPFTITQPTSNSSDSFSYTSSNLSVATIYGDIINIVGPGSSTITATQQGTANYTSKTITTTFQVNQSSPTNPVIINNNNELLYFMNTSSSYANITNNLEINDDLIASSYKVLTGNNKVLTGNNISITKSNN